MRHCGLDFGTSNSVICVFQNGEKEPLFLLSEPTVLFFPDDTDAFEEHYVGNAAIEAYLASGMRGRFFQSIKSLLSDADFLGTEIRSVNYNLVDLLELIMGYLKGKAEQALGPINSVTIGRPVFFSEDAKADQLAQYRLNEAAKRVGFLDIHFQFEPIAAALAYEARLTSPELVLVADFGGGTTDYTVMKLSPTPSIDRKQDILSIGGVYIGGDAFDAQIMRQQLTPYFGSKSSFKEFNRVFDVPQHFFNIICAWADIARLKSKMYQLQLKEILWGSNDKPAIERLMTLINHDLGFAVFKAIEKAKQELSRYNQSKIIFSNRDIQISDSITREQFFEYIHEDCERIQLALDQTLARAGLTESDIDTVFLTGGTSLVGRLRDDFVTRFGEKKLNSDLDLFTSVAQGLGMSEKKV